MPVRTLTELFLHAVEEHSRPDQFRVKREGRWTDVSSADFATAVAETSQGLVSMGVEPGDRVALLSENRLEWAMADLAALCARAVVVPLYPTLNGPQIGAILEDCRPQVVFCSTEDQVAKLEELDLDPSPSLVAFEPVDRAEVLTLARVRELGRVQLRNHPGDHEERLAAVEPADIATLIYTSGTTGTPKGVMLSHHNIVHNILEAQKRLPLSPADSCLSFLPLSHIFERMAGYYTMLLSGVSIAYAESVETVARDMTEVRPTIVVSVPRLYEKIYSRVQNTAAQGSPLRRKIFGWAHGVALRSTRRTSAGQGLGMGLGLQRRLADTLVFRKLRQRTGGNLRFFVSGGAPLAQEIAEFFHAAGLVILEGYGLTETSPVIAVNSPDQFRAGSVGRPLEAVEVRIAEDGEILTRSDSVMQGYYHKPEETAEAIRDGWFHTGDIGHLDEDGYLFITDRKKDLLVTAGGKNIAPQHRERSQAQQVRGGGRAPRGPPQVPGGAPGPGLRRPARLRGAQGHLLRGRRLAGGLAPDREPLPARGGRGERGASVLRAGEVLPAAGRPLHPGIGRTHPQPEGQTEGRAGEVRRPHRGHVRLGMATDRSPFVAAGLADFALYVTMTSLPFRLLEQGATSLGLGLVPFLYAVPYAGVAWWAGRGSARIGRVRSVRAGALGAAVAAVAVALAPSSGWMLAAVPGLGLSLAFYWPALQAAIADRAGADLADHVGRFNIGWSSGKGLGFLTGGLLTAYLGGSFGALVAAAAFLGASLLLRPRGPAPAVVVEETDRPAADRGFREIAWAANGAGFGLVGTLNHHYPAVLGERGIGADWFGVLLGAVFLTQVGAFWWLARTADRWAFRAGLLRFALAGAAISAVAVPWLPFPILVGLAPLFGLGLGFFYQSSLFYSVHSPQERGGHAGIHETVLGLSAAAIPFLGGIVAAGGGGLRAPFVLSGVALAGVAVLAGPRLRGSVAR